MSIKRTIITTLVALTLVAVVAPGVAQGVTIDELMAQIAQLQAQLVTLQGGSTTTTVGTGACAGVTFSRNLTTGATGSDVKCLQTILNANGYQVAAKGAGSPGNETSYFGPATLAAVKKFQVANGWTPANQVGPMTRQKLNTMIGSTTGTGTTPPVVTSGPVSAMLSSDTPVAGAIVTSQASADLLHVNFTGSGTVTSVTLQRSGISDQNTLTNVYLYDGNIRITDGYSFNVGGQIVINGLSIAVNGSKVISVRADVASNSVVGSAGTSPASTIGVALSSYTAGSAITANVKGNIMNIVTGNLASVNITTAATSAVPNASVNAGTTGYTFWSAPLQVNTRAVMLKVANFRMVGSAPSDALSNIKLFIDGVDTGKVATVTSINGSNYASFDLTSAPISLTTGSHTVDVRADVQKGTNRDVTFSVQQASDLMIYDPQVGVNIAVSSPSSNSGTGAFAANSAGKISISTGSVTVTVDPTFTSQTNISGGSTNAVIGRFKIHAYGEDAKFNSLNVIPSILGATSTGATCTTDATTGAKLTGTCGLNNVTLYFNGTQVGSQVNYAASTYTMGTVTTGTAIAYTLGSQMVAPAGQDSILEVRADLQTTANVAYTGGTVKVGLPIGSANVQGMSSQQTYNGPTGAVATNGLTIQTGQLVASANPSFLSQSVAPNQSNVRIGSYVIQNQSTSESIRLTSYSVVTNNSGSLGTNDLTALRTSDTTGSGATPIQPSGGAAATSTDVFSVNNTLAPGASMVLDIFANTGGDVSGTISTTLNVTYIGTVSNIVSTTGIKTGASLTLGTGAVATPTIVVSSTTPSQYIAASVPNGADNGSQATFSFISTSGASTITDLKFAVSGSDATPSQTVKSICVGSVCGTPVAGVVTLTGLNLSVPNGGGGLIQNVAVSYSGVGTGGIVPGMGSTVSLTYVKYTSGGSTATLDPISVSAPMVTLVGSKPTVTVAQGGNTGMVLNASTKVGQVTVTADAKGSIKVRKLTFAIGYSGFTTPADATLGSAFIALGGNNIAIAGSSCTTSSTAPVCTLGTTYASDFQIAAGQSQQFDLYITTTSAANTGTNKAQISSSLTQAGFIWDDTSANGVLSEGEALTGSLIYGFPTNSYSVSQ